MTKAVGMNRLLGTARSFDISIVDDGYIRIYGGMLVFGRQHANMRRDELSVSISDVKAAIAEYEAMQVKGAEENK